MKKRSLFSAYHVLTLIFSLLYVSVQAQTYSVDRNGVLRDASGKEAAFFGVNYTLPFAHAFRMHKFLGVNPKEAIDKDVYHFARLGFNAYRIHVWDVEVSDTLGNLLENQHLDLLDYLVFKLKERNIKVLFTPIAYWGNGYPEQDEPGGFSSKWGKGEIAGNEEAIRAHERYITQFMDHINPYTGKANKEEPDLVGVEISNEPYHPVSNEETKSYVNRLVGAIRSTGCKKPVFYNASINFDKTQAFCDANIDGLTFQWYPSGLVAGHTRKENFLLTVDKYPLPFDSIRHFKEKARIIYEFDAPDVADPYIYPAIARTFRTSGFQWITQFSYDPIEIAWANTDYQTHYLNLAYTPGKAISMKIAAEVVKRIPRFKDFGAYPVDTLFDAFHVSYNEKLSEMSTSTAFFYSNTTRTCPKDLKSLSEIAGCGSSPVINYEGTGAYFLDKLGDGIWRLEVMPDAVWIEDPFGSNSMKKEVATVLWNEWPMVIRLPNLGDQFSFKGINSGNQHKGEAVQATMTVTPGTYLLVRKGVENRIWTPQSAYKQITLNEFVAPHRQVNAFKLLHRPAVSVSSGKAQAIQAKIIGPSFPDSVCLFVRSKGQEYQPFSVVPMKHAGGYDYQASIPAGMLEEGITDYWITVYKGDKCFTFPGNHEGDPSKWDYYSTDCWSVHVASDQQVLVLFDARMDENKAEVYAVKGGFGLIRESVGSYPTEKALSFTVNEMNPKGEFLLRSYIHEKVNGRRDKLAKCSQLCAKFGQLHGIDSLQIGFITTDGFTYKTTVKVTNNALIHIPIANLQQTVTILRPMQYPGFMPDYRKPEKTILLDLQKIDFIEISTGSGLSVKQPAVDLFGVWLE
jgi:Cellulase (glycosyl hydrolase family 5).